MRKKLPQFLLLVAATLYLLLRHWGTRRGATAAECARSLPGDEVIPHPHLETTHALTIHAAPEFVWPWVIQLGYYRGGWHTESTWRDWDYYPDQVLRFFVREEAQKSGVGHRDVPSVAEIVPEFQKLEVGDVVLDGPPGTAFFTVLILELNRHLVLHSDTHLRFAFPKRIRENPRLGIAGEFSWGFYLQEAGDADTRLLLRTRGRVEPRWYRLMIALFVPLADFFLASKMLHGIKQRAESSPIPPAQSQRDANS